MVYKVNAIRFVSHSPTQAKHKDNKRGWGVGWLAYTYSAPRMKYLVQANPDSDN